MKDLIFGSIITGALCFLFIITLLLAIFTKRRKKFLIASILIFIAAIISTCYTVFTTVKKVANFTDLKKVANKVDTVTKPRTGEEIYAALLGKPETDCVKVLHHLDKTIPIMDYAIALHFETCPQELRRLISIQKFTTKREKGSPDLIQPGVAITWFRTDTLGDSINVFTAINPENASGQIIYSSLDSTKVMLVDYAN